MSAEIEAELARALTLDGLAFNTFPRRKEDGTRDVTAFHLPFSLDDEPLNVWAYLVGSLYVATTALRLRADNAEETLTFVRALDSLPVVRLVRDASSAEGDFVWLEAATLLMDGPWSSPVPATLPIHMVVSAARRLHERFPGKVGAIADAEPRIMGFVG